MKTTPVKETQHEVTTSVSPTTLEAANILKEVASGSTLKTYKVQKKRKTKTGIKVGNFNVELGKITTGSEGVNTGSTTVNAGSGHITAGVTADSQNVSAEEVQDTQTEDLSRYHTTERGECSYAHESKEVRCEVEQDPEKVEWQREGKAHLVFIYPRGYVHECDLPIEERRKLKEQRRMQEYIEEAESRRSYEQQKKYLL